MQITARELIQLWAWFSGPVHGVEARQRNVFVREYKASYEQAVQGRKDVLASLADKDENGKAIVEQGKYKIPDEKLDEAKDLVNKYLDETTYEILPETKGQKESLRSVYTILKDKPMVAGGITLEDGEVYDSLLTKIEEALKVVKG